MAVTYTDNIQLGMQLDKTEYLNWDVITQNWQKIDNALGGGVGSVPSCASLVATGTDQYDVGTATFSEVE